MRLEVSHLRTCRRGDLRQETDLVRDLVPEHVEGNIHRHPAEVLPVGVGHLRPDRDSASYRLLAGRAHDRLVTGVVATRHVRAGHHLEEACVVGDTLPEVGIEIDYPHSSRLCREHPV